jgi:hypothetical protein
MNKRKNSQQNKKQLALELDQGCGSPRGAEPSVSVAIDEGNKIISLNSALTRQERENRGILYANIMSLANHLD